MSTLYKGFLRGISRFFQAVFNVNRCSKHLLGGEILLDNPFFQFLKLLIQYLLSYFCTSEAEGLKWIINQIKSAIEYVVHEYFAL